MSEATITTGLMAVARETATLGTGDVVFADTSVLDEPGARELKHLIFWPAERWENAGGINQGPVWTIPAWLYVPFTNWPDTYAALRTVRQEIIDAMDGDGWAANGLAAVLVRRIYSETTGYDYGAGVTQVTPGMMPLYVVAFLVFEVEEF